MLVRRSFSTLLAAVAVVAATVVPAVGAPAPGAEVAAERPGAAGGDDLIDVVVHLDLTATGGTGLSPAAEESRRFVPFGRVPAEVALERAQSAVVTDLLGAGGQELHRFERIPYLTLRVERSQLDDIAAHQAVRSVDEDQLVEPFLDRSLPLIGAVDSPTDQAVTAGGAALTGSGRTIAVIDTGILRTHEMFTGVDITEACFVAGGCPRNNQPQDVGDGAAPPRDFHGTHVAGIALGTDAGNGTLRGVAPQANLVAVRTFPDDGGGSVADLGNALEWLATEVAKPAGERAFPGTLDAVNLSLGAPPRDECATGTAWDLFRAAVDDLLAQDVVTVAAAGNDSETNRMSAPACIDTVISVANLDTDDPDRLAASTNVSTDTDLAAPGTGILSALVSTDNGYGTATGSSMAAPHAAGAIALLREAYPDATPDELRAALRDELPGTVGVSDQRQGGVVDGLPRLDLRSALLAGFTAPLAAPINVTAARGTSAGSTGSIEVSWDAVAGADGYHAVTWPGGATCSTTGQATTACTVTGLPGEVAVRAWVVSTTSDGSTSSASAASDAIVPFAAPDAPDALNVEIGRRNLDVGEEVFATVSWEEPADGGRPITAYEVALTQDDGSEVSGSEAGCTAVAGDTTSCELTGLTENADYRVTVAATNDQGTGPETAVVFTAGTAPAPPTAPAAVDLRSGGALEVSWTPSGTATTTAHRARAIAVEGGAVSTCEVSVASDECAIDGLVDGAVYDIEVVALNAAGASTAATGAQATPTGPPGAPTDVIADPGDAQATVRWTAPVNDGGVAITTYDVWIVDSAMQVPACSATAAESSCTVSGLANGSLYRFTVQATNNDAGLDRTGPESAPSAAVTPATTPDAPTAVDATALDGGTSIEVGWILPDEDGGSPLTGAVARAVPTGGGDERSCSTDTTTERCTITGLPSAAEVQVTVSAVNTVGEGTASAPVAVTTLAAPAPAPDDGGGGGAIGGGGGGGGGGLPPADPDDGTDGAGDGDAPEPVTSSDGALPAPETGTSELLVGEQSVAPTTVATITSVELTGAGTSTIIAATAPDGFAAPIRNGALTLPPSGALSLRSSGLSPGSGAALWLFSEPQLLGTGTVGADGQLDIELSLPADVVPGDHTLQLASTAASGEVLALSIGVAVGEMTLLFGDVARGTTHWLAIERLAEQGVARGGTDGRYQPSTAVSRGQMAAFLDRLLGLPAVDPDAEVALSDIAGSEHEASIRRLVAAGIASGFTDGTFRPGEPVRRGQMATFLANAADLDLVASGPATDVAGTTHEQAIHAVMAARIASGFSDGTYRPALAVTRAQMATLLVGLDDTVAEVG